MNQFNLKILQAKKRQQVFLLRIIIFIIMLFSLALVSYFLVKAKKIIVKPKVNSYYIDIIEGKGLLLYNRMLIISDTVTVIASSEGYETVNIKLTKDIDSIKINLIKKNASITFRTNTEIGINKWFLNNKLISEERSFNINIKPDNYKLRIENNFYKTKSFDINMKEVINEKVYDFKLERSVGVLNIITKPEEANIFLGEEKIGVSPINYELKAGIYNLRLEKKGYQIILDTFQINNSKLINNKKYKFQPNKVNVNLQLYPANGTLFINGALNNQRNKLALLPKKKYKFLYKKKGYKTIEREYFFSENNKNIAKIFLKKEYGKIIVKAEPKAEIIINNNNYGLTPKTIELQTIKQKIEIKKKGYVTFTSEISPKFSEISILDVKLEKKIDKINRLSKKEYSNSIGIKLKIFNPNSFTMGAPRHEKGQRANEFQRDVVLRKKFYVSLTEITVQDFMKYKNKSYSKKDKYSPIRNITWFEAVNFCNWLSDKEELGKVYNFQGKKYLGANLENNGYRLPTEAEWEWLARKSQRSSTTKFTWGKNLPIPKMVGNLADESVIGYQELYIPNYRDNYKLLAPVGTFKKDIAGLYDLTGNVKEWVHDYYLLSVPKNNVIYYDPSGPKSGVGHVVKGSSYLSATLQEIRASYRDSEVYKKEDLGFRIARYLFGKEFKNDEE